MQGREDAGLEFLLRQARGEGLLDSSGVFTLDPARAREKLAQFQLPSPELYILSLIAAAVAGGADRIRVRRGEQLSVSWNGRPPSAEELQHILSFALSPRASVRLRELGLGLYGAVRHRGEAVAESWAGCAGIRLRLSADQEELQPLPECPWDDEKEPGCRVQVGLPGRGWRRTELPDFAAEGAALEAHCAFAPASIRLDGRELTRPVDLGRCIVKKRMVGAGPQLTTSASATLVLDGSWPLQATAEFALGGTGSWEGVLFLVCGLCFPASLDLGFETARAVVAAPFLYRDLSGQNLVQTEAYGELVERLRLEVMETVESLQEGKAVPADAIAPLLAELADGLEKQQEFGKAYNIYHWLVARVPDALHSFVGLLRTSVRLEQYSLVEALYARLRDKGIDNQLAQACAEIGQSFLQRDDRDRSAGWFRRAVECLLGSRGWVALESAESLVPPLLELGCEAEAEALLQAAIMEWLDMSGDSLDHERMKPQVPETWPIWLQKLRKMDSLDSSFYRPDKRRLLRLCEWLARVLHSRERRVAGLIEVVETLARAEGQECRVLELQADLGRLEAESGFRAMLLELYRTEWGESRLLGPRPPALGAPETRKASADAYRRLLDRKIFENPAQASGIAARLAWLESLSAYCVRRIRLWRAAGKPLSWLTWDWKQESEVHRTEAERLQRILARLENGLGPEHPALAESLNAVGELLLELGRVAQAERCFGGARKIWETAGDSRRLVALTNLAITQQAGQPASLLAGILDGLHQITGLDPAEVALAARQVADREAQPELPRRPWTVPRRLPDRLRRLGDEASLAAARTLSRYSTYLWYQLLGPARMEGNSLSFELERYTILQRRSE
ncbi:MAG: tetratricopeptide repeat protein [Armatimonadetes bacterium]|nr:tetratricopeptide repeat protein [Armatimonadota bacterium]